MLTAADIKNITFSKAMGGFKPEEVDVFLDRVEADYVQFDRMLREYQVKIEDLQAEIENYKKSQDSIQNVLLNAQKLADQIVNEAKEKSEEIIRNAESNITVLTAQEKELVTAFEIKASQRKEALEKELETMISKANLKAESITAAAEDSVNRQQVLFDKLKLEIAAFKSAVTAKYKEHLSILQDIPETVQMDPKQMAEVISAKIDKMPNPDDFIKSSSEQETVFTENENSGFSVENGEAVQNT